MPQEVEQVQTSAPVGWSGKMSPELSAPTKERTLGQSSKKQSKSQSRKPPLFLSLRTDGQQPDASPMWEENGALLGAFSMLSFGECPSVENASHLSQILEASPHPKYSLSAKACLGYCPQSGAPWQRAAAPAQDGTAQPGGSTFCIQGNCIDRADTAGCNGKGWTEGVSYTLNTIDRPAVYSEPLDDVASTLRAGAGMPKHDADIRGRLAIVYNGETVTSKTNASNPQVGDPCHILGATGAGRAVVIENHAKAFSFDSLASNSMKSTNPHSGCREVGVSKTLDATRPDPAKNQGGIAIVQLAVENHPQDSRVKINEDGVVQTLSGQMGTGGGDVPLILENK